MIEMLAQFVKVRWRRFSDRTMLKRWQNQQMERFRRELLAHTPFYRSLVDAPLDSFPVMDKASVREHFAKLNTLGFGYDEARVLAQESKEHKGVTIGMSSGTSGNRGLYLVNAKERQKWVAVILAKALPSGALFRRHRVALFLAANSRLYTTTNETRRIAFRFFDLRQGLVPHIADLQSFQPTILVAPAHVLALLARQQIAGELSISPNRVFSTAEVLEHAEASIIASVWGEPVHQIYQCTEGFLGITCAHGTLHLNEDFVLFEKEWIDRARYAFNPVITDFSRRTQAIVRYRMNDVLIAAKHPCPCGSPLQAIERIEGRRDDIMVFPHANGGRVLLFPEDIRAIVLDAAPAAEDFRAVQLAKDKVEIALAGASPEQIQAVSEALVKAVKQRAGKAPTVLPVPYTPPSDHAVKMRRVQRSFDIGAWEDLR